MALEDKTIILSKDNWWSELADLKELPGDLMMMLRGLVGATLTNCITPAATPHLILLAKKYLSDGISIDDRPYDIMVYVPDDIEKGRHFFALIPAWPNGELKRLSEL